jgi:phasin family protein
MLQRSNRSRYIVMASKGIKKGAVATASSKPATRAAKPAAPKLPAKPAVSKPAVAAAKPPVAPPAPAEVTPVAPAPADVVAPVIEAIHAAPAIVETVAEKVAETLVEPVIEPAIETVTETAQTAADISQKEIGIMATTIENGMLKAQNMFGDINERAKAAVEKSTKLVEEMNDFAKGNVEALVESGKITAKGFETMGQEAADYSRKSFESATAALKSMSAVKSPADFFKLQSDFVRTAFDSYVAEASKNTEAMLKLAGEATQPISGRVAIAVEKVKLAA